MKYEGTNVKGHKNTLESRELRTLDKYHPI